METTVAKNIANNTLQDMTVDPDGSRAILARQFLRKLEQRNMLLSTMRKIARMGNVRGGEAGPLAMNLLQQMGALVAYLDGEVPPEEGDF